MSPTGYTACIVDGEDISFEQFALQCSRAMGASILQRDEALTVPLRIVEEGSYQERALVDARKRLADFEGLSEEEGRAQWQESIALHDQHAVEGRKKAAVIAERLNSMIDAVNRWAPPTSDHDGLKKFMLQQLEETLKYDGTSFEFDGPTPIYADWHAKELERLQQSVAYSVKSLDEQRERDAGRKKWITDLAESLGASIDDDGVIQLSNVRA